MKLNVYKNNVPPTARRGFLLIALAGALFALSPAPKAFGVDPPPGGGYPNNNTASGEDALFSLTTGDNNTAAGFNAMYNNTTGYTNTANGVLALYYNTTGIANTSLGSFSMFNSTGSYNTGTGVNALRENLTGNYNTAYGFQALYNSKTGSNNIAVGNSAGLNLSTGSNNIYIGNIGVAGESNKIRVGTQGTQTATFIAGIAGATIPNGMPVVIGSTGRLGTSTALADKVHDLETIVARLDATAKEQAAQIQKAFNP